MAISARRRLVSLQREAEEEQFGHLHIERKTRKRSVAVTHKRIAPNSLASINQLETKQPSSIPANPVMDLGNKEPAVEPQPTKPPFKWRVLFGNLASGAFAGCIVEAALYPLDTIKTRLQMMRSGGGISALIKSGGGKSLYAGIGGNLLGVAPATAVFMAVYEPAKKALSADGGSPQQAFLVSGSLAGWAASLVRVPTEVVKQRIQAGEFKKPAEAVRVLLRRDGLRGGLYAGYGAFLLRDLPFDAIEFWAFDTLNLRLKESFQRDLNAAEHAVCGAIAGAITGLATTPLDVLKTRLMTQGSGADKVYANVFDCAVKVYKQEGVAAFLKGWEPRVTWIAIGGCIFFTALEQAKKVLILPEDEV